MYTPGELETKPQGQELIPGFGRIRILEMNFLRTEFKTLGIRNLNMWPVRYTV